MKNSQTKLTYRDDPDNIELARLIAELDSFGLTQEAVAEVLGISPGQLSRIKSGERHASRRHVKQLRTHLRTVKGDRGIKPKGSFPSVFAITPALLDGVSPTSSLELFRDLLWSRATERSLPITSICISSDVFVPDGGIDASILAHPGPTGGADELLTVGTRFQIKTGHFAAWQKSAIQKELFGRKSASFENLGRGIQDTLTAGKRYVLVCFGVDPIPSQIADARAHLKNEFSKCGFPDAAVEVWGQTHLVGLMSRYPTLCLRAWGHDQQGFRSLHSWASDHEMRPNARYSPEQWQFIEETRESLRLGEIRHLRLLGEPGVGKTRLALEITNAEGIAPATLYVPDGRSFLRSSFINELVQIDDRRFAIIVIDECPRRECTEIWNSLRSRSDRVRLITIDHGPDTSMDDLMRVHDVEPVGNDQIIRILTDHGVGERDANRWADYCQGCPRVAHVVGENLHRNRADLLLEPSTVSVWDRFISGRDEAGSPEALKRRSVLCYLSLFDRFGYEAPVDGESRFIAELTEMPWLEFQRIIADLRQRRIIQGAKTLYITPRLLQVYLYREFWRIHGSQFDITRALETMPASLRPWFVQMLRYAETPGSARSAIERLLGPTGIFPEPRFPDNQESGRLIQALAEACPGPTLKCLQRTIGRMDRSELQRFTQARQSVVWALERIAVWKDHFAGAVSLLRDLATAENAKNSNNATGTFKQLFSLIPGMAATETSHEVRFRVLGDLLNSPSSEVRLLGLQACETALQSTGGSRMVGPEYQGLRKTVEFWMPKTYADLYDAYSDVWRLLVSKLDTWEGENRRQLISTLISAAWQVLFIKPLVGMTVETLKSVAADPATEVKSLLELIQRKLRYGKEKLSRKNEADLRSIVESLEGHDFRSTLARFVKHLTWEDAYDERGDMTKRIERKLDDLADEAIAEPCLLKEELQWLVCEDSSPAFCFAFRLAQRDPTRALLSTILARQAAAGDTGRTTFLSGYMAAVFVHDKMEWEETILQFADFPALAEHFSDVVISSGITDRAARKVVEQCRAGIQSVDRLDRWWFSSRTRELSFEVFRELVVVQLEPCTGPLWENAIRMCHTYFLEKDHERPMPEQLVFEVLTHEAMAEGFAAHSAGYYWSRLAAAYLEQFPAKKLPLLRDVLRNARDNWSVLLDLNTNEDRILTRLLREEPHGAFNCIAAAYDEGGDRHNFGLRTWLGDDGHRGFGDGAPGPIQFLPTEQLFRWVDEDVENRAYWLAYVMPKTFDSSPAGRLTRNFVARYGHYESVADALYAHFHSRSFCGNASDRYRSLREEARRWLSGESDRTVLRWIDDYIDGLSRQIEQAELDEERGF
jgi:transcriptional regulator with XRE-family HTH domain